MGEIKFKHLSHFKLDKQQIKFNCFKYHVPQLSLPKSNFLDKNNYLLVQKFPNLISLKKFYSNILIITIRYKKDLF
jgi:hypothetical protein